MFEQLSAAYARYDPYMSTAWRWHRVKQLASGDKPGTLSKYDGKYIQKAREFILAYTHNPEKRHDLFLANPGLFYAYQIWLAADDDPAKALTIEACILARLDFEVIAGLCKTLPSTIKWYAALFFDVKEHLEERYWINQEVLLPAMMRNMGHLGEAYKAAAGRFPFVDAVIARPFMDASLKYFAYNGGPVVLDYLLTGCMPGKAVLNADDLAKFFDTHWSMAARARSAQAIRTFEINKYNVMELFALHANIVALEKGADGKSTQQTTIERHVSSILDELPWTVGRNERGQKFQGSQVAALEAGSAAELRDNEIMYASAKTPLPQGLADAMQIQIPPPRRRGRDKDKDKDKEPTPK